MTHSHGAATSTPSAAGPVVLPRRVRLGVGGVLLALLAATVAGLVLLWPTGEGAPADRLGLGAEQVRGTVTDVRRGPCPGALEAGAGEGDTAPADACATVTVTIDDGPDAGEIVVLTEAQGTSAPAIEDGDGLVLARAGDLPLETRYQVVDVQRGRPLAVLGGLFAVAVVAVGRWRGLAALVGLGVTFALLTLFVLPALLEGRDPLQVAVVGSAAIMVVALYLSHGLSLRTTVALFGTLVSLALTGALAAAFVAVGEFSGLVSEEAVFLSASSEEIDLRGLLLAGILIGALGVLDDVTVTQTSAVFELHAANPDLGRARLAAGAMRIGRDHIASTVNTLVLAYAGASLPLLLLFVLAAQPVTDTLTNEVVAQEVVRALVGGLGIVASVPLTTALAVLVARSGRPREAATADPDAATADPDAATADPDAATADPRAAGQEGSDLVAGVPGEGERPAGGPGKAERPAGGPGEGERPAGGPGKAERPAPESPAPESPEPESPEPEPSEAQSPEPEPSEAESRRTPSRPLLSRWRRGSRRLRAEQEAADLLRGLRPADGRRDESAGSGPPVGG